ncbi:unnamed protein product [Brassica oleracea]
MEKMELHPLQLPIVICSSGWFSFELPRTHRFVHEKQQPVEMVVGLSTFFSSFISSRLFLLYFLEHSPRIR